MKATRNRRESVISSHLSATIKALRNWRNHHKHFNRQDICFGADGTVRQEIKIYYKFIGFVDGLHITPTKQWTSLPPRNCTVCGVEYVAGSPISKYCPECREKIRKRQGTETKRKSRERNKQACIELSAKNDRLV